MKPFRSFFCSNLSWPASTAPNNRHCLPICLAALVLSAIPVSFAAAAKPLFYNAPADMQQDPTSRQAKQFDRIKKEPTTAKAKLVAIDVTSLSGDSVEITLGSGKVLTYLKSRVDTNNHGTLTWYGDLADRQGSAILVVNKGVVTGSIRNHGELYKIESVGNGLHAVIETDSAGFPPEHPSSPKPGIAGSDHKLIH